MIRLLCMYKCMTPSFIYLPYNITILQKCTWKCYIPLKTISYIFRHLEWYIYETIDITLPNDQIQVGCFSPRFVVKFNDIVRAT